MKRTVELLNFQAILLTPMPSKAEGMKTTSQHYSTTVYVGDLLRISAQRKLKSCSYIVTLNVLSWLCDRGWDHTLDWFYVRVSVEYCDVFWCPSLRNSMQKQTFKHQFHWNLCNNMGQDILPPYSWKKLKLMGILQQFNILNSFLVYGTNGSHHQIVHEEHI